MNYRLFSLLLLILWLLPENGNAQEPTDTVKVIENARNVVVTRDGGKTRIEADCEGSDGRQLRFRYELDIDSSSSTDEEFDDNWGMNLPFLKTRSINGRSRSADNKTRTMRYVTGGRHIYWGWRFNYGDKGNVKNCFELGVRDLVGVSWERRGAEFEIGAGLGFRRILVRDGCVYSKNGDSIMIVPYQGDGEVEHSRMDVFCFHVPVIYTQDICKGLKFSIGAVMNLNTYAKTFTDIKTGKTNLKTSHKGLQQNLVTVDALASINLGGVGFYGCWSPMELFKKEFGPAVKGWSIGVELDF